jgi:hypothetical protein
MSTYTETSMTRALALAVLLPLAACSAFKPKPAAAPAPAPAPRTTPTTPATTPTTTPAPTTPAGGAARPGAPAAGQPAPARPAGAAPAGGAPTTAPAAAPTTAPAGAAPAGAAPAGAAPAGAAARGAATPAGATPAGAAPAGAAGATSTSAALVAATAALKRDSVRLAEATTTRRRSPVYFTLMFDINNARLRTSDNLAAPTESEPSLGSFEIALQKAHGGGLGIAARSIAGDDNSPSYVEVALLMGARIFALDLGAAMRTGFDSLGFSGGGAFDSTYIFPRAGFRSRANIGNTDFSVQFRGLYYIGIPLGDDALPKDELEGWSGETGLSWTWKRFPLTANLGYRIERFKVFDVEQESSAFTLGAGLLLGRR